jgi:DNA-binding LacI/PurR family transcriptional regulator
MYNLCNRMHTVSDQELNTPPYETPTKVTSRQIADRLGVSQATVSRVLRNVPGYQYSQETRQRIQEEAEHRGYRPHAVASSLREGRTRVIGFHDQKSELDARNIFMAEVIGSLQQVCLEIGHFLLLHNFVTDASVSDKIAELTRGRIDGLVVHLHENGPFARSLAQCGLPTVAIANRIECLPSVGCDERTGIIQDIKHLEERGHQRIAFASSPYPLDSAQARHQAYIEEMEQRGWQPVSVPCSYHNTDLVFQALQSVTPHPTAICCWDDISAVCLLRACSRAGVRVPDDLAVVGFDGLIDDRMLPRNLTTVDVHWAKITHTAVQILMAMLRGESVPWVTNLPPTLRIGETT